MPEIPAVSLVPREGHAPSPALLDALAIDAAAVLSAPRESTRDAARKRLREVVRLGQIVLTADRAARAAAEAERLAKKAAGALVTGASLAALDVGRAMREGRVMGGQA